MTVHIKLPNGTVYPHPGVTNFLDVQVDPTTDTVAVRAHSAEPGAVCSSPAGWSASPWNGARRNRR